MTEHGERIHARYSASGSNRWIHCAGSLALSDTVPAMDEVSSGFALDGTQAHDLLEYALVNNHRNAATALIASGFTWIHYYDNLEDRLDSVQTCLDYVWTTIEENGPDVRVWVECQFAFPTTTGEDAGGIADVVLYFPAHRLLYVIDFKHGAGHVVEVPHNPQIKFYMVGAITEMGRNGLKVDMIAGVVVQPRAPHADGPVREWVCEEEELIQFVKDVDNAIRASTVIGAPRNPGEWCKWCPASVICPEFESAASRNVALYFASFKDVAQASAEKRLPLPQEVPLERLGDVLDWGKIIADWYDSMREYAMDLARHGYQIPNRKLVFSHARRKWDAGQDPEKIALELASLTGLPVDEVFPRTLINITEAENEIKKAIREVGGGKQAVTAAKEAMAYLTVKEQSGNMTLVGMDDKRPPVSSEELFKHVSIKPIAVAVDPVDPLEP